VLHVSVASWTVEASNVSLCAGNIYSGTEIRIYNFFSRLASVHGGARNSHLGAIVQGVWRTEVPSRVQGQSPGIGSWVAQKLKHFADIVDRFWLQQGSTFENFAQFSS